MLYSPVLNSQLHGVCVCVCVCVTWCAFLILNETLKHFLELMDLWKQFQIAHRDNR